MQQVQKENFQTSSFFDDEDITTCFQFNKFESKDQDLLSITPSLKTKATCKCLISNTTRQGTFALVNEFLFFYENDTQVVPTGILNLNFARLKSLLFNPAKPVYGFRLTKNGNSFEIYFTEAETTNKWNYALKNVCVMTNFHNEYKAIRLLGQGGFARVYLTECKSTGKQYAVKAFYKDGQKATSNSSAKAPLKHEIEMLRAVDHENIIKLYEVQESDRTVYLVMEYVESKTLYEILKKPDFKTMFSDQRLVQMIQCIFEVLVYLASKGIMHRDLKPENILVEKSGKLKIIDLGLATPVNLPKHIFKKCGTPGYIAPEVFLSSSQDPVACYNEKCDVFSAGCIMFFLLFGQPMFGYAKNTYLFNLNKECTDVRVTAILFRESLKNTTKIQKAGLDLLKDILLCNPEKRFTAEQALENSFFDSVIPRLPSKSTIMIKTTTVFSTNSNRSLLSHSGEFYQGAKGEQNLSTVKTNNLGRDSIYSNVVHVDRKSSAYHHLSRFGDQAQNQLFLAPYNQHSQVSQTSSMARSEDLDDTTDAQIPQKKYVFLRGAACNISKNTVKNTLQNSSDKNSISTNNSENSIGDENCEIQKNYLKIKSEAKMPKTKINMIK